ncbi:hypothetical protein, partial [Streptomyces sp. NPDC054838]
MPPAEPIRDLAALLRGAGLDPSAEELADALWLAGRTGGPAGAPDAGDGPAREPEPGPGRREGAGAQP